MNPYIKGDAWQEFPIPVVRLPDSIARFASDGVSYWLIGANDLPYDNLKFITVLGLLRGAERQGRLKGIHTLVEATSGNTGLCLATMAPHYGISNVVLVAAPDLPAGKRDPLAIAGATLQSPPKGKTGITFARELGRQADWLNLDQYANIDGAALHEAWTGPAITDQLLKESVVPTVFVAGIGTGGTLIGVSRHLRKEINGIKTVGVLLEDSAEIPGVRDKRRMAEITLPWRGAADHIVEARCRPAYRRIRAVNLTLGTMFGPSSGFSLVGAENFAAQEKARDNFASIRDKRGEVHIAVFCPDSSRPYGDRFAAQITTEEFLAEAPEGLDFQI